MAKPLQEITKTEFNKNYNVVKVLTTKTEIMAFVKTQYQESKNNVMAFVKRKTHKVTLEDIMNEVIKHRVTLDDVMNEIMGMKTRLDNLEDLMLKVIKLNNLKYE